MEFNASLSIEAQPTNLRFRTEKDGAKGMLKSEDGPVKIKLSLQKKAAKDEKYFATCYPAAQDDLVDGLIQLSPHALNREGASKFETVSDFMKTKDDGLNYFWTLPACWIVSNAGRKIEHTNIELPNISFCRKKSKTVSNKLYLAFTVFKYDNNSNTYTKCTSTIFSKCIYNAKALSIDGFFFDNQDHMLMLLSDTIHDYILNVRHLDEQNNLSTCCEINLTSISEEFIEGKRNPQKSFRKSSKLMCYPRPQLRCLSNNPIRGPLKLQLQLHHDHIRSNVRETMYTPSKMLKPDNYVPYMYM